MMDMGYAIALGNFDGLHIGHQCVIETAKNKALNLKCKSAVVTFSPHPHKVLSQYDESFQEILSHEEKITMIKAMGIDDVFVIDFSLDFSKIKAEVFIAELCNRLDIKSITTGYNFKFGYRRQGDVSLIKNLQHKYGFKYNIINQIFVNGCPVSSSVLRNVLKIGCVQLFAQLTGKYYHIDAHLIGREPYVLYMIKNQSTVLPPKGCYFVQINGEYFCLFFVSKEQFFIMPVNHNNIVTNTDLRINFIQIIRQYYHFDRNMQSELLIENCIKSAQFCLSQYIS